MKEDERENLVAVIEHLESYARIELAKDPRGALVSATLAVSARLEALSYAIRHQEPDNDDHG